MRKVIISCDTKNLGEFRELCKFAKEIGATHVVVSQIEKSMWQWDANRNDPYPCWALYNPTIFKFAVPEKLKKYLPADYAERNLETMVKRGEILKEFGIKGAFCGMEPSWLPEEVFIDHPSWRGPRVDQTRRSRAEYYVPCLDNEEVREMYSEAIEKLCRVAQIEYFEFMTKDSGSGFCWQEGLYPGKNGPAHCRNMTTAERIVNFLSLIQNTANKLGLDAEVGFTHFVAPSDVDATRQLLKPKQFCGSSGVLVRNIGSIWRDLPTYPVKGIPLVGKLADEMMATADDDKNTIKITIPDMGQKTAFAFIRNGVNILRNSVSSKYEVMKETAKELIGEKYADKLVDIWDNIDRAQHTVSKINYGGPIFVLGTVHQRWISRPLVPFPERLTDEEKAHFRPFLFQAETEKEANNLLNMQGTVWLGGESAFILINRIFDSVKEQLDRALGILNGLISMEDVGDYVSELKMLKTRIMMYKCILNNTVNVIRFQTILDRTDYSVVPQDVSPSIEEQGDIRWYKMSEVIRNEMDNTIEMIQLLEEADGEIFYCTDTEADEDIMMIGPEIKEDLKKKLEIMRNHKYEINELYKSFNV